MWLDGIYMASPFLAHYASTFKVPSLADEAGPNYLGGATTKAIADTAAFLVEQGKIPAALPDYSAYVTTKFVTDAAK